MDRVAHARDLWPRNTLRLSQGQLPPLPLAIAQPQSLQQIQDCLKWATEHQIAMVPYGAGSGVCGAAAGMEGAITLDMKGFHRIGPIDAKAQTVRVQAGVLGQHLEDALEKEGFATRHSPSSIWCSTVGGWAASRSAGQFSSKYGKFEDMVLAMEVVTPTGVYRTGAWAEGEDLGPWFLGTEGALGVITELLVRVVPLPKSRWLRGYRFETVEQAWSAMRALLQQDLHPAALRLYDPVDTRLAGKGTIDHQKGQRWWEQLATRIAEDPSLRSHALSLPLSLPRLINALADRVSSGCVLIVGWEGEAETVAALSAAGQKLLLEKGAQDLGAEPGEHWYKARHEVSYKMAPIFIAGAFADTMEVASLWSRLPELYHQVRRAIGKHGVVMAHFSHAYQEGCSIYFTFSGTGDVQVYDALWADALEAAAAAGGTVAHHHGVGQLKQAAAARELAAIAPRYHALKKRLDPANILNPGRIFPIVSVSDAAPAVFGIDPISQVATLDPREDAHSRDQRLQAAGWALRFPTDQPLLTTLSEAVEPWETRLLGATLQMEEGRRELRAVPRSAAGPDLRGRLPLECYEAVVVPLVPLHGATWEGEVPAELIHRLDIRPSRRLGKRIELRGIAAKSQGAILEKYLNEP